MVLNCTYNFQYYSISNTPKIFLSNESCFNNIFFTRTIFPVPGADYSGVQGERMGIASPKLFPDLLHLLKAELSRKHFQNCQSPVSVDMFSR